MKNAHKKQKEVSDEALMDRQHKQKTGRSKMRTNHQTTGRQKTCTNTKYENRIGHSIIIQCRRHDENGLDEETTSNMRRTYW